MTKRARDHLLAIFIWAAIFWFGSEIYKYAAVFFVGMSFGIILMDYLAQHKENN